MDCSVLLKRFDAISKRYRFKKSMGECFVYRLNILEHFDIDTFPYSAISRNDILSA